MNYLAIDSVSLFTPDLAIAIKPFEVLGLQAARFTPSEAKVFIGEPSHQFCIRLHSGGHIPVGLTEIVLRVTELAGCEADLKRRGAKFAVDAGKGIIAIQEYDRCGVRVVLQADTPSPVDKMPSSLVRRLDHLAVIAADLDEKTTFWAEVLGIKHSGEIKSPQVTIRQLKIGDAILELLGADWTGQSIRQTSPRADQHGLVRGSRPRRGGRARSCSWIHAHGTSSGTAARDTHRHHSRT